MASDFFVGVVLLPVAVALLLLVPDVDFFRSFGSVSSSSSSVSKSKIPFVFVVELDLVLVLVLVGVGVAFAGVGLGVGAGFVFAGLGFATTAVFSTSSSGRGRMSMSVAAGISIVSGSGSVVVVASCIPAVAGVVVSSPVLAAVVGRLFLTTCFGPGGGWSTRSYSSTWSLDSGGRVTPWRPSVFIMDLCDATRSFMMFSVILCFFRNVSSSFSHRS